MKPFKWLVNFTALISATLGGVLLVKNRMPWGMRIWPVRILASSLSPFVAVAGLISTVLGLLMRSPFAALAGLFGTYTSAQYVWKTVAFADGFEPVFGPDWWERIPAERKARMLQGHWTWLMPAPPQGIHQRDVPFATIPGTDRRLLCDLWLPPSDVNTSGLSLIYLHGSAWYIGDKDMGTRVLFRHLAAQGHVVMDVAYRMSPETDMAGMVGDAKRAIAWMKEHAAEFGVDPERIVMSGASAGAHLAMLAAYSQDNPELTPLELQGLDLTVRGVVSIYGPADMVGNYFHTAQHITTRDFPREIQSEPPTRWQNYMRMRMGDRYEQMGLHKPRNSGAFLYLLGGHPEEIPEVYELYSPIHHVRSGLPPTLLIHGSEDLLVPVEATIALERKLRAAGVPVISLILPQTDHAYDLFMPRISPPAQSTLYMIERFLALLNVDAS